MAVYLPTYTKNGKATKVKTYWLEFVIDGKRVRKSTGETNKRKAEAFAAAYRTQLLLGKIGLEPEAKDERRQAPQFAEAIKEFLVYTSGLHNLAPSSRRRNKVASVALLEHFRTKRLSAITDDDINAYIAKRLRQKSRKTGGTIAPATVNRERTVISQLFDYFEKQCDLKNPFGGEVPTVEYLEEDNEICNPLSLDDERQYLAACSPLLRDFAVLMIDTGMRNSEVLNLTVEDVDLANGRLWIRTRHMNGSRTRRRVKTKASKRMVPLSERAKEVLARRMSNSINGLLFSGGKDGQANVPPLKLNNAHYGALKRSGVKRFRLYDLRHTFATRHAEMGTDLITLKDLLGHSNLDMLRRYAHPSDEHKANAIKRMEAARSSVESASI